MRLSILQYHHAILRSKCAWITQFGPDLRELAANMLETMRIANGVGLAAPQVGDLRRIIVLDRSRSCGSSSMPDIVLVNPEIELGYETDIGIEGCLSFPRGLTVEVERAKSVVLRAQNLTGFKMEIKATGLYARVLQHEVDHLDGILMVDYL